MSYEHLFTLLMLIPTAYNLKSSIVASEHCRENSEPQALRIPEPKIMIIPELQPNSPNHINRTSLCGGFNVKGPAGDDSNFGVQVHGSVGFRLPGRVRETFRVGHNSGLEHIREPTPRTLDTEPFRAKGLRAHGSATP